MPKQINLPNFAQGLVQRFALKGRFQPVLDETIVPVAVVTTFEAAGAGGGVPNVDVARSAWGYSQMLSNFGGGVGSFGWSFFLVNPVGSGVGINVRKLTTGLTWQFGAAYPSAADAKIFYTARAFLTDQRTMLQNGASTTYTENVGWRDDRLSAGKKPVGIVGHAFGSSIVPSADRFATFTFPDNWKEVTPPGAYPEGGARVAEAEAILIAPGRGLYVTSDGFWEASSGGGRLIANWQWDEVPFTAGTRDQG